MRQVKKKIIFTFDTEGCLYTKLGYELPYHIGIERDGILQKLFKNTSLNDPYQAVREFFEYLEYIYKTELKNKFKKFNSKSTYSGAIEIWCHNLKYDGERLFPYIVENYTTKLTIRDKYALEQKFKRYTEFKKTTGNTMLSFSITHKKIQIDFRCTLVYDKNRTLLDYMTPEQQKIKKSELVEHGKEDCFFDGDKCIYTLNNVVKYCLTKDEEKYLINDTLGAYEAYKGVLNRKKEIFDVVILGKYIHDSWLLEQQRLNFVNKYNFNLPNFISRALTAPGFVKKCTNLKLNLNAIEYWESNGKKGEKPALNASTFDDYFRPTSPYIDDIKHCRNSVIGGYNSFNKNFLFGSGNFKSIDIKSQYPANMRKLPIGLPLDDPTYFINNGWEYCTFVLIKYEKALTWKGEMSGLTTPPLPNKNIGRKFYILKEVYDFLIENTEGELKWFKNHDRHLRLEPVLADIVNDLVNVKETAPNEQARVAAKICVNSLFGKTIQRPNMPCHSYEQCFNLEGICEGYSWNTIRKSWKQIEIKDKLGYISKEDYKKEEEECRTTFTGIYITNKGRLMIWEAALNEFKKGNLVIYIDTDSLKIKVNTTIATKYHNESEINPNNALNYLGKFIDEGDFTFFACPGKKKSYLMINEPKLIETMKLINNEDIKNHNQIKKQISKYCVIKASGIVQKITNNFYNMIIYHRSKGLYDLKQIYYYKNNVKIENAGKLTGEAKLTRFYNQSIIGFVSKNFNQLCSLEESHYLSFKGTDYELTKLTNG